MRMLSPGPVISGATCGKAEQLANVASRHAALLASWMQQASRPTKAASPGYALVLNNTQPGYGLVSRRR